ncbi:MAG: hypothetical protein ACYDDA_04925 [Acidiferrobacteraceae bacterium]
MSAQWWRDRDWVLLLIKKLQAQVAGIIGGTGLGYTSAATVSGQTYAVQPTDRFIIMSTVGTGPTANQTSTAQLSPGTYIGEMHYLEHKFWGTGDTPAQVVTSGCSATPIGGYAASGTLIPAGTPQAFGLGTTVVAVWDGFEWDIN